MRFRELVKKSDFSNYYFIISVKDVKEPIVELDGNVLIDFSHSPIENENEDYAYYNLNKIIMLNQLNTYSIDKCIDKCKKFTFEYLEHIDYTCYIHLKMK